MFSYDLHGLGVGEVKPFAVSSESVDFAVGHLKMDRFFQLLRKF